MQWILPSLEPGPSNEIIYSPRKGGGRHAENSTTWLIVAKERPLWARKRRDVSRLPLHRSTWCLLVNPQNNASRFELLVTCQQKSIAGIATYRDIDCGLGIHPKEDQAWIEKHLTRLTSAHFRLCGVAGRTMGPRDYVTVQLEFETPQMRSGLTTTRDEAENEDTNLVRLSFSSFKKFFGNGESVLKALECTKEGRIILQRRKQRSTEASRRAQCNRSYRRTGVSLCEKSALEYGISFSGSKNVYTLQKSRGLCEETTHACCAKYSH